MLLLIGVFLALNLVLKAQTIDKAANSVRDRRGISPVKGEEIMSEIHNASLKICLLAVIFSFAALERICPNLRFGENAGANIRKISRRRLCHPPQGRARHISAGQHDRHHRRPRSVGRGFLLSAVGGKRRHRADPAVDKQTRPLSRQHALALRSHDGQRRLLGSVSRTFDHRAPRNRQAVGKLQSGLV